MFNDPPLFSKLRQQEIASRPNESHGVNSTLIRHGSAVVEVDDVTEPNPQSMKRQITRSNGVDPSHLSGNYPTGGHQSHDSDADEEGFRGRRPPVRSRTMGIPQDGSPALSISRQGTGFYPATPGKFLFNSNRMEDLSLDRSEGDDAQIVPISPIGDGDWQQITMGGNPYLVHRDTLDDLEEEECQPPRAAAANVWRRDLGRIEHVDSGLGDMDPDDVRPSQRHHTELAGIGEHINTNPHQQMDAYGPPQHIADDFEVQDKGGIDISQSMTENLGRACTVDGEEHVRGIREDQKPKAQLADTLPQGKTGPEDSR